MPYRSIVCGVTGSEHAIKAVERAVMLARRDNARLTFVHAVDDSFVRSGPGAIEVTSEDVDKGLENIGKHLLDRAVRIAVEQGVTADKVMKRGLVLEVLRQVIQERNADLLLIGHEERSFFNRILFKGNVEDHVQELRNQTGIEVEIVL